MADKKKPNQNYNPNAEWKNSWKDGWKNPAFQNVSEDTYVYQREDERSKYQQWKDIQKDAKSEHIGIRHQARQANTKIILSAVGTLIVVVLAVYFLFIK